MDLSGRGLDDNLHDQFPIYTGTLKAFNLISQLIKK
jgi:hypothetical protein